MFMLVTVWKNILGRRTKPSRLINNIEDLIVTSQVTSQEVSI